MKLKYEAFVKYQNGDNDGPVVEKLHKILETYRPPKKYDAFISYRHGGLDGLVAEKLHKLLETYRIPTIIAKRIGRKKLTRVFRDREELPTSSNLSDSITEALENSAFMLLICSKRTCKSMWVMREVELFSEIHGKDKIITLLIDGEPDESFPPGLREREIDGETIFVEPLAADIRSETWKGSIKLLKEEKLRMLAPLLGCAYDDLRRRHRRRLIQQVVTIVTAVFTFLLTFGSFSTWQYIQINRQMQLKLENQSLMLAEYSQTQLSAGDRDIAKLLALSALPENPANPNRPLISEAEMALANALGVYDVTDGFKAHRAISLPSSPSKVILSPDEKYAAALYPFGLGIYDTETGNEVLTLPTIRSALADVEFISNDILVFTGRNGIEVFNVKHGEIFWQGEKATALSVSGDKSVIAAVYKDESFATIYRTDDSEIRLVDFSGRSMNIPADDSFINPHDTLFALNNNGTKLAVSFADGSLSVFDISNGQEKVVKPQSNAIHYAGGFYDDTLLFSVVEREPYYSALVLYDVKNDVVIRHYESQTTRFIPHITTDGFYVAFDNQIMYVNAETGDVRYAASSANRIEAFNGNGSAFIISENNGTYHFTEKGQFYESDYICHFLYLGKQFALTGSRDANTLRILKNTPPAGNLVFAYDQNYRFSEAKVHQKQNRIVFYSYSGLRLYDLAGNIVNEVEFPDPYKVINIKYDVESGNIAVIYESAFRLYSGLNGSLLLDTIGKEGEKSVVYTELGVSVLYEDTSVILYDLTSSEVLSVSQASITANQALLMGNVLVETIGTDVVFNGKNVSGELVGANSIGDGNFAFAVSDEEHGKVFKVSKNGQIKEQFNFAVCGRAEVYFNGGFVFVAPFHGEATAYLLDGSYVRTFSKNGYMAGVSIIGENIAADYISTSLKRYSLLLKPDTLETIALLPGFLGEMEGGMLILDNGRSLHSVRLHSTEELIEMAKERLDGRVLTAEEVRRFKAG